MTNALEIKDLRKDFGDFSLKDISFSLPEGYIMGLIGPNGAGKTTTIKLIMNLLKKNGGSISLFGKDHIQHEVAVKSRIGFVYDNPNFYGHLTLKQVKNIIAPFYKSWDEKAFSDLADRFDLPLKKTLKKFSRGMVMKAAIAIALSHHADLIIMDEPTSGLDPKSGQEFLNLLIQMRDQGKSVFMSTHDIFRAKLIADRVGFMKKGRLVMMKTRQELAGEDLTELYIQYMEERPESEQGNP